MLDVFTKKTQKENTYWPVWLDYGESLSSNIAVGSITENLG